MAAGKIILTLATLAVAILLSSCGWHLRGQAAADSVADSRSSATVHFALSADDIYTPMYRIFKSTYEKHRVNLEDTKNRPQLQLLSESIRSRILSLNTELEPGESELAYNIRYQIVLPKQAPQVYQVELYRTYIQDKNRASASDNERAKLIDEMRVEAAERVLNQVIALSSPSISSP